MGFKLAVSTIAEILRRHGIEPAPERSRKTTWKEFLAQHWGLIVAADFFNVEVWTWKGLKRFWVLFFIDLATRQVEIASISSAANGFWMSQVGRNATDAVDGILFGKRYLIHDRDPLFTAEFQQLPASVGVKSVKLPRQSPNLNAYAERFVRTIKESCLERLVLFGERSLRSARARIHTALSEREAPSRAGQPIGDSGFDTNQSHGSDSTSAALGRNAEFLSACRLRESWFPPWKQLIGPPSW